MAMQQCAYHLLFGDHPLPYDVQYGPPDQHVKKVVGQAVVEAAHLAGPVGASLDAVQSRILALQSKVTHSLDLWDHFTEHKARADRHLAQSAPTTSERGATQARRALKRAQKRTEAALRRYEEHRAACGRTHGADAAANTPTSERHPTPPSSPSPAQSAGASAASEGTIADASSRPPSTPTDDPASGGVTPAVDTWSDKEDTRDKSSSTYSTWSVENFTNEYSPDWGEDDWDVLARASPLSPRPDPAGRVTPPTPPNPPPDTPSPIPPAVLMYPWSMEDVAAALDGDPPLDPEAD